MFLELLRIWIIPKLVDNFQNDLLKFSKPGNVDIPKCNTQRNVEINDKLHYKCSRPLNVLLLGWQRSAIH